MVETLLFIFLDIFIMLVSSLHNVCKKGFYIAIISTNVETNNPEKELEPAFDMIGPVSEKFVTVIHHIFNAQVSDLYVSTDDGSKDNVYVSSSFDATSHYEPETLQVL